MSDFEKVINDMRNIARTLIPHTYPQVSEQHGRDISILKQRLVIVDGYEIILCYSEAMYVDHLLKTIEIQSTHSPFLPFSLIVKIAKRTFGLKNISYVEFFRDGKKVYCWLVKTQKEGLMEPDSSSKPCEYEGFEFNILHPSFIELM